VPLFVFVVVLCDFVFVLRPFPLVWVVVVVVVEELF
jgi:hypothetical protein